jgi:histidinol dehydrogenase
VFPFSANTVFSPEFMEEELRKTIVMAAERNVPVRDICFSGNGEPSLSPDLGEALRRAARVRDELVPGAELVIISNGTGLLRPPVFALLNEVVTGPSALRVWLKLDAGTPGWYAKMNLSAVPFGELYAAIQQFAAAAPVILQTMLCSVDGMAPPPEEAAAWEALVAALTPPGAATGVRKVHIYGKARPAPEDPKTGTLPAGYLEERAASLRRKLGAVIPVEVYP